MTRKNIVSFSGGRTSAYLVNLMEKKIKTGEIDNVHYVFMDTGAEHPKTYDFIRNCVSHFGIDLICLRALMSKEAGVGVSYKKVSLDEIGNDLQPWRDMLACYSTPYIKGPMCTDRMKTTPYRKYCNDTYGKNNYDTWLGIRIDEGQRLKPRKGYRYLAEISPMDKVDVKGWWKTQPFDLGIDEWLGNCVFCIKKGNNKIALAAKDEPELANAFQEMLETSPIRIIESREDAPLIMYRGRNTFKSVVNSFAEFTKDNIIAQFRGGSGCTDSCEVFGCQIDMFESKE